MAHLAILDILLERGEHTAERAHLLLWFGKQMQHQTQSGLTADAGKFRKLPHCPL
jgi:hypothetical protein